MLLTGPLVTSRARAVSAVSVSASTPEKPGCSLSAEPRQALAGAARNIPRTMTEETEIDRGDDEKERQASGTAAETQWRRNARTLAACNFGVNLGWGATFAFLPLVVRDMGVGDRLELWVGAIMFGYFVTSCVSNPLWGILADHYGRKSMVLRAGLGMGVGFTLLSFITDPVLFLLLMTVVGMANGFIPSGMALIATTTPGRHMGGALALAQSGGLLGNLMGPLMGAALLSVLIRNRSLLTVTGATIMAAGIVAMVVVREAHVKPAHPLRFHLIADLKRLMSIPRLGALYYMNLVFASTVLGANTVVSLFTLQMLKTRPDFGHLREGTWIAITTVGLTVASIAVLPLWGKLLNRHDPARLLRIQLAGSFVTSLLLPLVQDPLQLAAARVLFGCFIAGLPPTVIRMVKERAPQGMEARALSYGTALQNIGSGGAPLMAGMLAPYVGLRGFFWLASAMILIGLVLWLPRSGRGRAAFSRPPR
jgi:MFS transporter, DHA1 family, multidrug resistance protein